MPKSQLRPNPHPAPGYARRAALRARPTMLSMGGGYSGKVLGTGPIAYWPLWETSGADAHCLVNPAQNGTAVGVTWADALGPDGVNGAPFFDGANDYVDVLSAALTAAFDGDNGALGIWAKVFNAGVWTDGITRAAMRVDSAGNIDEAAIPKHTVNNQFRWRTKRNNVFIGTITAETSMVWELWSMSWDAGNFYLYRSGTLRDTVVLAQPWTNPVVNVVLGAGTTLPTWPWHGWLAHGMMFDYTVPQTTWQALSTV